MDIGSRLHAVRTSKGLSQRELAKRVGVTNSTISLIEQNKVSPSVGSRRGNRQMCILREVMPPGSDTGDTSLSHDGEEGGVIIQGQVEITVGDRVKVLGPGEAYYFESRTPHRFRNVGNDDAIIVSANTPATF